ncbi:MAG: hypothetical protein IT374_11560 [Polyangiaceae bacterium]|nr:hypothetical protein [Polyangiaceae bacterium]
MARGATQGGAAGAAGLGGAGAGGVTGGGAAGSASYPAPIAYWPLDTIGGVATAELATSRGAMHDGVSASTGLSGGSMRMGSGSGMWVPSNVWSQPLTAATFSMWVRPDGDWTIPFGHEFLWRTGVTVYRGSSNVTFRVGSESVSVTKAMVTGRWYHIVATYESGVELSISVEDALSPGAATKTVVPSVGTIAATGPLSVLQQKGGGVEPGAIDDLAIFETALPIPERAALYTRGLVGDSPLCPACAPPLLPQHVWRFDGESYDRPTPELVAARPSRTQGLTDSVAGMVDGGLHVSEVLALPTDQPGSGVLVDPDVSLHPPEFTLAAWVRADRELVPADADMAWFRGSSTLPNRGFWFGYDKGVTLVLGDGTMFLPPRHTQMMQFPAGSWIHVAATFDGATTSIYLDGQLTGTANFGATYMPGNEALTICGNRPYPAPLPMFPGACDEVVMFDKALSLGEIQALRARGAAGLPVQ